MKQLQKHVHWIITDKTIPASLGSQNHHLLEHLLCDLQNCENKDEMLTKAKEIFKKVQYFLSRRDIQVEAMSMQEMLEVIGVDLDHYTKALQMSMRGTNTDTKA